MEISFENKVALVTGAGSGMGLATAKAFADSGAAVALADHHFESRRGGISLPAIQRPFSSSPAAKRWKDLSLRKALSAARQERGWHPKTLPCCFQGLY